MTDKSLSIVISFSLWGNPVRINLFLIGCAGNIPFIISVSITIGAEANSQPMRFVN